MSLPDDLPLPFPPDSQQVALMQAIVKGGNHAIASEGTDRYDLFEKLVEGGYMARVHCPGALGVHQFSVTLQGLEVIQ